MLSLFACISGILLSFRFTVIALLPLGLIGSSGVICYNWTWGRHLFAGFGEFLFVLIIFQAGYFLGLLGQDLYAHVLTRHEDLAKRT